MAQVQKHLMHVFPSFGAGGVPIRITAVMNHFGNRCRHTVIALDGNADAAERIEDGIDVTIIHPEINKKHPLRTIGAISGHIRKIDPDMLRGDRMGAGEPSYRQAAARSLRKRVRAGRG